MRSKVVRMLALALFVCGAGVCLAQQPKRKIIQVEDDEKPARAKQKQKTPPAKSKLEEMLAEALKNNPDIRVAAAKLAEADAELNRARIQVTQKVVALHHAILSQRAAVELAQKKYHRMMTIASAAGIALDQAKADLSAAKAKLAELEAQMPVLLGRMVLADFDNDGRVELFRYEGTIEAARIAREKARASVVGPLAERMRKALQTPVKVDYKDVAVADVFKDLEKKAPGLALRDSTRTGFQVTLHFEEALPVSALLQALADDHELRFTVREYGIRVMLREEKPPLGAMSIEEFLRHKPAEK